MTSYRLYFLGSDGHFMRAHELACESDEEAVAWAEARREFGAMELWSGARLVRRFAVIDSDQAGGAASETFDGVSGQGSAS